MASPSLVPFHLKRRPTDCVYARPGPCLEPDEATPGTVEAWEAVAPIRPDTDHVRALRFLDMAGDLASGVLIIAGGIFAYGFVQLG